jgi:hypothetical protein
LVAIGDHSPVDSRFVHPVDETRRTCDGCPPGCLKHLPTSALAQDRLLSPRKRRVYAITGAIKSGSTNDY